MKYSSRILSLFCLATILTPLGASAAARLTISDVVAIVQSNKKPLAFSADASGKSGKATMSFRITGTQNGNMKSLSKAAAELTMELDAAMDKETTGHAVMRAILVDSVLYVRLDSFATNGMWAQYDDEASSYIGTWFSIPVDQKQYAAYITAQARNRRTSMREVEAFFEVLQEQLQNKTRYTVTIPKNKQRRLLTKIFGKNTITSSPTIDMNVTVDAVKNIFDSMNGFLKITTKYNREAASLTFTAKTSVLHTPPTILAPANSTPWGTFVQTQTSTNLEDARNAQRRSDINTILNATYQYAIDNNGNLPPSLSSAEKKPQNICTSKMTCDGISLDILNEMYLVSMPKDPSASNDKKESGYTIRVLPNQRITVSAPLAEGGVEISVTR